MTNFNEIAKNNGIDTFGYDVTEVTKYLSDEMKDRFAKASEDVTKRENCAFIAACYDTFAQMRAVTETGKLDISDGAIMDKYNLLLGNTVDPINGEQ